MTWVPQRVLNPPSFDAMAVPKRFAGRLPLVAVYLCIQRRVNGPDQREKHLLRRRIRISHTASGHFVGHTPRYISGSQGFPVASMSVPQFLQL